MNSLEQSAALTGECTFYHGGRKGRPIPIQVRDEAHRVELLNGLCNDPEVEGFEIAWDKPPNVVREPSRTHDTQQPET